MKLEDLSQLRALDADQVLDALGLQTKSHPAAYIAPIVSGFALGFFLGAGLSMILRPSARQRITDGATST